MDVETNIKSHMPGRQGATHGQRLFVARHGSTTESSKVFKKTPFVSGLHSVSRDVVKDMREFTSIPLLTTTSPDQDVPQAFAVAGRTIAESSTAVKPHSHQSVLRSADRWTARRGDALGVRGRHATAVSLATGISNGKLTDGGLDARPSKRAACATNHTSGTHVTFAKRVELTSAGALSLSGGGDLENHSYADI